MADPTRIHPVTGKTLRRGVRPLTLTCEGPSITVDMPGWYPEDDGDSIHTGKDMQVSDEALARLKRGEG